MLDGINASASRHREEKFASRRTADLSDNCDCPVDSDAPTIVDISEFVRPGDNVIVVENGTIVSSASVQAVAEYYIPWNGAAVTDSTRPGSPDALRLAVKFDKTDARAGDEVHCSVKAERIGSQGWGMMIAEIGLPPGADVDRRVLDEVIISQAGRFRTTMFSPTALCFTFGPSRRHQPHFHVSSRYGLKARTAPSILYDYYNPEALVALPPADFNVKAIPHSEPVKRSRKNSNRAQAQAH